MPEELIDIYNSKNQKVGSELKSKAHQEGLWHRCVHAWMHTADGEILIQQRAKTKEIFPDMWDISAAGHVGSGESVELATLRETSEEIGIKIDPTKLKLWKIIDFEYEYKKHQIKEFFYVYIYQLPHKIEPTKLQATEVQDYKYISTFDLKNQLQSNPEKFTKIGYWLELVKEVEASLN